MVSIFLTEGIGNFTLMSLARRYNGLAILWEDRFYGESHPFELDEETWIALALVTTSSFDPYEAHSAEDDKTWIFAAAFEGGPCYSVLTVLWTILIISTLIITLSSSRFIVKPLSLLS